MRNFEAARLDRGKSRRRAAAAIADGRFVERLVREFDALGIDVIHAWGMSEMSPVGGACSLPPGIAGLPREQQMRWRIKRGRSPCGVDLKLLGPANETLPHDGKAGERLLVRGPAVVVRPWCVPDTLIFTDSFPLGSTGKVDKQALRERTVATSHIQDKQAFP